MIASPPGRTQTYNTRWPPAVVLPTALVGGAVLRLVAVEAPVADSLGILRHQLLRIRVARVDHNAAQSCANNFERDSNRVSTPDKSVWQAVVEGRKYGG
jgi:hypothetical protein